MRFLKGIVHGGTWIDIPEEYAEEAHRILGKYSGTQLVGKIASILQELDELKKGLHGSQQ